MAQQINLYHPILLTPKRYFSALAMAQALGLIAVGAALLCAWAIVQTRALRADLQDTERKASAEKQLLLNAIASNPSATPNTTALEQSLVALQQGLAQRQQVLDELTRGTVSEGRSHSALLRLVAQTVPSPAWLTDIHLAPGRLEITGLTLDPAALRPWIGQLSAEPLLAGQQLGTVRVERQAPSGASGTPPPGTRALPRGVEAWTFTLVSASPAASAATAASGVTP